MTQTRKNKRPAPVVRNKEELLAELGKNEEWRKNMLFLKEQFWPALCAASNSIEDASILIGGFNNQIMEAFLARMKDVKLGELGLEAKMDTANAKHEQHKALVALFADMDVFTAKSLIEGMRGEIEQFKIDEMKQRPLDSLKTRWLDD